MDTATLGSFVGELEKWAALSDKEKAVWKQVVRNQAKFDQEASSGDMSEARKELHRQNTERMKHFADKRKNDNAKIPRWAADPKGKMPGGSTGHGAQGTPRGAGRARREPYRHRTYTSAQGRTYGPKTQKVLNFMAKHPTASAATMSAALGAAALAGTVALATDKKDKKAVEKAFKERKVGPIKRYIGQNPVLSAAGMGAVSGLGAYAGTRLAAPLGVPLWGGFIGGAQTFNTIANVVDKRDRAILRETKKKERKAAKLKERAAIKLKQPAMTKEERNRKRREEYARKSKVPSIGKPKAPKVRTPKMPKAA